MAKSRRNHHHHRRSDHDGSDHHSSTEDEFDNEDRPRHARRRDRDKRLDYHHDEDNYDTDRHGKRRHRRRGKNRRHRNHHHDHSSRSRSRDRNRNRKNREERNSDDNNQQDHHNISQQEHQSQYQNGDADHNLNNNTGGDNMISSSNQPLEDVLNEVRKLQNERKEDMELIRTLMFKLVPPHISQAVDQDHGTLKELLNVFEKESVEKLYSGHSNDSALVPISDPINPYLLNDQDESLQSLDHDGTRGFRLQNNHHWRQQHPNYPGNIPDRNEKEEFAEDMFSVLMIADRRNLIPAVGALLVFASQMTTYSLVIFNVINFNDPHNFFNFPPNVDMSTRLAQILAITITVATQEDLRTAMMMWWDGYSRCTFVTEKNKVTRFNWILSVYTRGCEGFFGPVTTFLLIMQSTEVVDLLLNFSAIEFVSMIDDTSFNLAAQGFLGKIMKEAAREVSGAYYYRTIAHPNLHEAGAIRRGESNSKITNATTGLAYWIINYGSSIFYFTVSLLPLIIGWIIIFVQQQEGMYSCKSIFVQFDDSVKPKLGSLSGVYRYGRFNGQVSYQLEDVEKFGRAQFQYCDAIEAWAFWYKNVEELRMIDLDDYDPCVADDGYVLHSSSTDSMFDLSELESSGGSAWFVNNALGREISVTNMRLFCFDCQIDDGVCGEHGECTGEEGSKICECKQGWYGNRCGFREPCKIIEIDTQFGEFTGVRDFADTFYRLGSNSISDNITSITKTNSTNHTIKNTDDLDVFQYDVFLDQHHRPVYFFEIIPYEFDIIMFTGRRWVFTDSSSMMILKEKLDKQREEDRISNERKSINVLIKFLKEEFHTHWSKYEAIFYSEPVDVDTPKDSLPTPVGLGWFEGDYFATNGTQGSSAYDLRTVLLCSVCNQNTNRCQSGGICTESHRCECKNRASGALCHISPIGDGYCDTYFNQGNYQFDGGDCCQATCLSTNENKCGYHADEDTNFYVGFDYCKDRRQTTCQNSADSCWLPNIESIFGGVSNAESGFVLSLSANGHILAVAEPGVDRVRVFKSDGSQWMQIGETLQGESDSRFGESLFLSADGETVIIGSPELSLPNLVKRRSGPSPNRALEGTSGSDFIPSYTSSNIFGGMMSDDDIILNPPPSGVGRATYQGQLAVYELRNNAWDLIEKSPSNETIDEEISAGRLGASFSLSKDKKIMYIAFPFSNYYGGVVVFLRNETNNDYFSTGESFFIQNEEVFQFRNETSSFTSMGRSISTSDSGDVAAFGGRIDNVDHVLVYKYKYLSTPFAFEPTGPPILGCCAVISGNGQVLAVSLEAPDRTTSKIYHWEQNATSGAWSQRGGSLNGKAVALSFDGLTVALSVVDINDRIQSYVWNDERWEFEGQAKGAEEVSVILFDDKTGIDTFMLVGSPLDNSMGPLWGISSFYQLMKVNQTDNVARAGGSDGRKSIIRIELTTDGNPNEIIWELRDPFTQKLISSGGPYSMDLKNMMIVATTILPDDVICAEFSIYDIAGNGICCDAGLGLYTLYVGGEIIKSGREFTWSESVQFGHCQKTCAFGESLFTLELKTDGFPSETSWELSDVVSGEVLFEQNDYIEPRTEHVEEFCLPSKKCTTFIIRDSYGDGLCCNQGFGQYIVSLDGRRETKGGEFFYNETHTFGPCSIAEETQLTTAPSNQNGCPYGLSKLVVTIYSDENPNEIRWFLHSTAGIYNAEKDDFAILVEGGPFMKKGASYSTDICIEPCIVFEIFDSGNNGINLPVGYSLFLDDEEIQSNHNFTSYDFVLIGNCDHVLNSFHTLPRGSITCQDDISNECMAPASCAYDGIQINPAGDFIGEMSLSRDGWKTVGAYSLSFGNKCNVVCKGHCYSSCKNSDTNMWLMIKNVHSRITTSWKLSDDTGTVLAEGRPAVQGREFDQPNEIDQLNPIVIERSCISSDICGTLTLNSGSSDRYILFLNGQRFQSGIINREEVVRFGNCSPNTPTLPPLSLPTLPILTCKNGTKFRLELSTDSFPEETSWSLKNEEGVSLLSGGPYSAEDAYTTIIEEGCIAIDICLTFTIIDEDFLYNLDEDPWNTTLPTGYVLFLDDQVAVEALPAHKWEQTARIRCNSGSKVMSEGVPPSGMGSTQGVPPMGMGSSQGVPPMGMGSSQGGPP